MRHTILRFCLVLIAASAFTSSTYASGGSFNWDSTPSNATPLPPFYKIACTNNMALRVAGTDRAPSVFVTHQPENKMLVSEVVDGTLYLSVIKQQDDKPAGPEAMTVSLKTGPLKEIAASGNCEVDASKVKSYGMELTGQEEGQIYIDGNVKVNKIIAQGHSYIEVIWADADRLYMNAFGTSKIKIAGVAKEILARSYGEAHIDAQYLRTNRVNVFAKHSGFAQVLPLCEMRAFAEDTGRIDYFTVPNNAVSITQSSGNILWMGYRN